LATIIEYIAERNDVAALDLADDIERATSQLPQHPYLYRPGRVAGTREIVVHPNYPVVYRVQATVIEIVTVLHSRQQYPTAH
jgi:toxin ParE1/3/4